MKIAIYGTGNIAESFYQTLKYRRKIIEIVYFVETCRTKDFFHDMPVIAAEEMITSEFDRLVIASDSYYDEILEYLKSLDNGFELFSKAVKYDVLFQTEWEMSRRLMPYQSCRIENKNIVYVATSEDRAIPGYMFRTGINYEEGLINAFFELVKKYYKYDFFMDRGYFLDIGANIGTTSIYVKKMNDNLNVIGFEAGNENYTLFRVNCILNHVEDIKTELIGLSNNTYTKKYKYVSYNSGKSEVVEDDAEGQNISEIMMMKLDDYLNDNHICLEDIHYIWVDAEGHESEIIEGAIETLKTQKIPLLQEFNPEDYLHKGRLKEYCENMTHIYDGFIDVRKYLQGELEVYEISQLYKFALQVINTKRQTDLFFFLDHTIIESQFSENFAGGGINNRKVFLITIILLLYCNEFRVRFPALYFLRKRKV